MSKTQNRPVSEQELREELSGIGDDLMEEIQGLKAYGFVDGSDQMILTPLGLAILRQIEEDKLQELG